MDSAEAIFQFNTTNEAAEGLVNNLNSSATTDRFVSQLSSQGGMLRSIFCPELMVWEYRSYCQNSDPLQALLG